jgi:membrane protease YdiL (CAAX protease family)
MLVVAINAYYGIIRSAHQRAGLAPTRPYMYLRTMLVEFVIFAVVVLGVRIRGGSLQAIFGQRWRSFGQLLTDLGLGISLLIASTAVASILGSHRPEGASADSISYLLPQTSKEMLLWMALSITAGVCEEAMSSPRLLSCSACLLTKGAPFAQA